MKTLNIHSTLRFLRFGLTFSLLFSRTTYAAPSDLEQKLGPRPIDGVYVEAVQNYVNPKKNLYGFDFGIWPVNPYYNGFSLSGHYTRFFNKDSAWEVINLSYLYTVDSNLTTELADQNKLTPNVIERPSIILSSNYIWNLVYGKFVFMDSNIRYFRSSFLAGPAFISTNTEGLVGLCVGWMVETFVNEKTSWRFQLRDNYAFGNSHPNNVALSIGTTYSF